ncbi:T-cell receptor alpha chain V region CTL-F3 [Takifugu flavidus]|nr:T-cell receptor alpha chain V region CTL-F3 [Takifugu flavidus]
MRDSFTLEGHMTQEEVCSSVSNHAESRKSCQKRTRPPPNVEHQTVSPAALELLAEMEPWLWILLAALCFECRGEDKVMQPPEDVVAAEGDTVTLDCTFQTTDPSPYLFWYKQENNNFPKLLLRAKKKPSDPQRISALINKTSAPLKIQELQLSDSAVYYCALRPTVTGSSRSAH